MLLRDTMNKSRSSTLDNTIFALESFQQQEFITSLQSAAATTAHTLSSSPFLAVQKTTQELETPLLKCQLASPENLPRTSQNQKKSAIELVSSVNEGDEFEEEDLSNPKQQQHHPSVEWKLLDPTQQANPTSDFIVSQEKPFLWSASRSNWIWYKNIVLPQLHIERIKNKSNNQNNNNNQSADNSTPIIYSDRVQVVCWKETQEGNLEEIPLTGYVSQSISDNFLVVSGLKFTETTFISKAIRFYITIEITTSLAISGEQNQLAQTPPPSELNSLKSSKYTLTKKSDFATSLTCQLVTPLNQGNNSNSSTVLFISSPVYVEARRKPRKSPISTNPDLFNPFILSQSSISSSTALQPLPIRTQTYNNRANVTQIPFEQNAESTQEQVLNSANLNNKISHSRPNSNSMTILDAITWNKFTTQTKRKQQQQQQQISQSSSNTLPSAYSISCQIDINALCHASKAIEFRVPVLAQEANQSKPQSHASSNNNRKKKCVEMTSSMHASASPIQITIQNDQFIKTLETTDHHFLHHNHNKHIHQSHQNSLLSQSIEQSFLHKSTTFFTPILNAISSQLPSLHHEYHPHSLIPTQLTRTPHSTSLIIQSPQIFINQLPSNTISTATPNQIVTSQQQYSLLNPANKTCTFKPLFLNP